MIGVGATGIRLLAMGIGMLLGIAGGWYNHQERQRRLGHLTPYRADYRGYGDGVALYVRRMSVAKARSLFEGMDFQNTGIEFLWCTVINRTTQPLTIQPTDIDGAVPLLRNMLPALVLYTPLWHSGVWYTSLVSGATALGMGVVTSIALYTMIQAPYMPRAAALVDGGLVGCLALPLGWFIRFSQVHKAVLASLERYVLHTRCLIAAHQTGSFILAIPRLQVPCIFTITGAFTNKRSTFQVTLPAAYAMV